MGIKTNISSWLSFILELLLGVPYQLGWYIIDSGLRWFSLLLLVIIIIMMMVAGSIYIALFGLQNALSVNSLDLHNNPVKLWLSRFSHA